MKTTFTAFTLLTLGSLLPVSAQVTETRTETETRQSSGGAVTETRKSTVTTFNPEVRTRAVQYFEAYKTSPHGLPPAYATRVKVKEIPAAWRTARVAPGVVITERERPYLVEAPPELVKVLPPPTEEVRYYLAGRNVVAVNKTYQVVDSIQIPSVRFEAVEAAPAPPTQRVERIEPVEPTPRVEAIETVEEVETLEPALRVEKIVEEVEIIEEVKR